MYAIDYNPFGSFTEVKTATVRRRKMHYLTAIEVMKNGKSRLATICRPMLSLPIGDDTTEDWDKVDCKECLRRRYW